MIPAIFVSPVDALIACRFSASQWGNAKDIDPDSQTRRYSKNSPSFDEGVKLSKISRRKKKADEVEKKLAKMAIKMM